MCPDQGDAVVAESAVFTSAGGQEDAVKRDAGLASEDPFLVWRKSISRAAAEANGRGAIRGSGVAAVVFTASLARLGESNVLPSSERSWGADQSNQERSVSLVPPGGTPTMPTRSTSRVTSTRPSRETSWRVSVPGSRARRRLVPLRVTALEIGHC